MKRFLLSFLLFLSLGSIVVAQEMPCPTVTGVRVNNAGDPDNNGICDATVSFEGTGDVQSQKGVQVEVFCNGTTSVLKQCFIIPKAGPQTTYTTGSFSCPCSAPLTIVITRFTASNGECQGGTCGNTLIIDPSPLPVKFKFFTASRNKEKVAIKWETASESNNKGFNVQRKTKGEWENIAFVFSAAQDGNSNTDLSYSFSDVNNTKGLTQYRIQQVDIDNRTSYSDTRSVKGEGASSKLLVYPNPSNDGKVNVVFEDQLAKTVVVRDMSGRMIKQFKNVVNNLSIINLENGMYSIQVTDLSTATITVEKVIIKKR